MPRGARRRTEGRRRGSPDKHTKRYTDTQIANCARKARYDKRGARGAANVRYAEDHVALKVYHCGICKFWHLTSPEKRARGRRTRWVKVARAPRRLGHKNILPTINLTV